MIVGPGIFLLARADIRQMFDASDVVGIGAVQVAPRIVRLIELNEIARLEHLVYKSLVLLWAAVAPVNIVGLCEVGDLGDPVAQGFQSGVHGFVNRVDWPQEAGV